jgi:hypothetical protein
MADLLLARPPYAPLPDRGHRAGGSALCDVPIVKPLSSNKPAIEGNQRLDAKDLFESIETNERQKRIEVDETSPLLNKVANQDHTAKYHGALPALPVDVGWAGS